MLTLDAWEWRRGELHKIMIDKAKHVSPWLAFKQDTALKVGPGMIVSAAMLVSAARFFHKRASSGRRARL